MQNRKRDTDVYNRSTFICKSYENPYCKRKTISSHCIQMSFALIGLSPGWKQVNVLIL